METYVLRSSIHHALLHLVKLRASYLNGCAYCVDMHAKDARAAGETEQRIFAVPVWRETPFVDLTMAVIAVNGRNRLAVSFRTPPGSYARREAAGSAA